MKEIINKLVIAFCLFLISNQPAWSALPYKFAVGEIVVLRVSDRCVQIIGLRLPVFDQSPLRYIVRMPDFRSETVAEFEMKSASEKSTGRCAQ